jgi:hypothetical protein
MDILLDIKVLAPFLENASSAVFFPKRLIFQFSIEIRLNVQVLNLQRFVKNLRTKNSHDFHFVKYTGNDFFVHIQLAFFHLLNKMILSQTANSIKTKYPATIPKQYSLNKTAKTIVNKVISP